MAGSSQALIVANESTENIPSSRRVRDVSSRIAYLDPDSAPFTAVTMRSSSKVAVNSKFEWIEKEEPNKWDAINSGRAGHSASGTPIGVENEKFFTIGDILVIPRTKERMRVISIDTTNHVLGVTRGVGNTGATAVNNQDDILIIGNAYKEGDTSGQAKSVQESYIFNYTQIFRTPLAATGSEMVSENYTGPDRTRLRLEKAREHKVEIERTALFGDRNIDTTATANPIRFTGGLLYYLTVLSPAAAKQKDFGGVVTEPELEDWLQDVFEATGAGDSRVLMCSPLWLTILDQLAAGRLQVTDRAETYGVTVRNWVTAHGSLSIVKHRLLQNNPNPVTASPSGFTGYALAIDFNRVMYRFLRDRSTKLLTDIQAPDYDGFKDEYMTECGWQVELPKVHGVGYNATG